ncbi:MAG: hypothetical protein GY804_00110 [Alphaproteobacteria bacterium]|nr:hypothetical protein [Alphaproteobacteria bacterium]
MTKIKGITSMLVFTDKTLKEITKVGFKDWLWFTVHLERDEFSDKLDPKHYNHDIDAYNYDQKRAYDIAERLENLKS